MICSSCGFDNPDGALYCTGCGAPLSAESRQETQASNAEIPGQNTYYSQQAGNFNSTGYSQQPPYGYAPYINDKAASVRDYLKWMLLYPLINLIPGVGTIAFILLCLKFAFDSSFKARAAYFKAVLIVQLVIIAAIAALFVLAMPVLVFLFDSAVSAVQDFDHSFFYDGNFDYHFNLLIR